MRPGYVAGIILTACIFTACTRAPIKDPSESMRATNLQASRDFKDDLELAGLTDALKVTVKRLKEKPNATMKFGGTTYTQNDYAELLETALKEVDRPDDGASFRKKLDELFEVNEVYGTDQGWSDVFVTAYFSPIIEGSLTKKGRFTSPVLRKPKDLVRVSIGEFAKVLPSIQQLGLEDALRDGVLRGRLQTKAMGQEIVPYPARNEIRSTLPKLHPDAVICYLDPVDHFFTQIQGSGTVNLGAGKFINLIYSEQNGHPYFPIGRALKDKISKDDMSLQSIRQYLHNVSAIERMKIMDLNPSFVFFDASKESAVTAMGVKAQAGRSIATDSRYFPKGALAYLRYPKGDDASNQEPGRYVFDHDTGGAIRGPGRVDLYWGEGAWAEEASGRMKGEGKLYYFVPRPDALGRLAKQKQN